MSTVAKKESYKPISLKPDLNVIKPKVKNGKVLLNRKNPLHRYIYED